MGRPRVNDEATAGRLVDTAVEMLSSGPPDALTARGVANRAGTSTTAIYTLFDGLDGLLAAVRRRAVTAFGAALAIDLAPDVPPLTALVDLGAAYRRWAQTNRSLYLVLLGGLEEFVPADSAPPGDPVEPLMRAVTRAIAEGLMPGPAAAVATSLWAGVHGVVSLELHGVIGAELADRMFDATVTALVRGWCTDPTAGIPAPSTRPHRRPSPRD